MEKKLRYNIMMVDNINILTEEICEAEFANIENSIDNCCTVRLKNQNGENYIINGRQVIAILKQG